MQGMRAKSETYVRFKDSEPVALHGDGESGVCVGSSCV